MDPIIILHAGLATGTILLFAAIGEIFAERAGILNLGVEGMMLLGAMAGFSTSLSSGSPWFGLFVAMLAGGIISLAHGLVTIHFQADQVVSGLSLTFLGTGLALVLGEGLTGQNPPLIPAVDIPLLSQIPVIGPIFFLTTACWCTWATSLLRWPGITFIVPALVCTCGPLARSQKRPIRWASTFIGCVICMCLWGLFGRFGGGDD